MIEWIQEWFQSQCNGDWEHQNTIKIETIDNPGWNVEIDFGHTALNHHSTTWVLYERSETDWIGFKIENNVFIASGDPTKLEFILVIFNNLVNNNSLNNIKELVSKKMN